MSELIKYSGDQFGYYTVGSKFRTYSKLLAIEEMRRTGQHLEWHFNETEMSCHDWTREPTQTLAELYRQRAQQIRDSYDYVVIWYSGGADSWNILESFLANDIPVDEIAHCHSLKADRGNKHSDFNEETFFTAIPRTQEIVQRFPNIYHRVIDLSDTIDSLYDRPEIKFDFIYNTKSMASANSLARSYLRDDVPGYREILDSGRRMVFVWGTEKPRLTIKDSRYHVMFQDSFSETNIRIQSLADQGYFDEWFYWSPYTAALVAKQCHALMRVLETSTGQEPWFTDHAESGFCPQSRRHGRYLTINAFNQIIYPGWDINTLVQPKPRDVLVGHRDDWFWKQNNNPTVNFAKSAINQWLSRLGPHWANDPNDLRRGVKGCINLYCLE